MLRKLMKYELKSTARTLLPLYGALIMFALINKIFIGTGLDGNNADFLGGIPAMISVMGYACTMAAVFIVTFFVIVQRFYKNLLGDEGYLMNTLPVPLWKNIASKLFVGVIWTVVSGFVAFISILIMMYYPELFNEAFKALPELYREAYEMFGFNIYLVLFEILLAGFASMIAGIGMIYASISIGHLFNKRRILASFGAFIGLNMLSNIVIGVFQISFFEYIYDFNLFNGHGLIWAVIGITMISVCINFGICNYILKNKLNLE